MTKTLPRILMRAIVLVGLLGVVVLATGRLALAQSLNHVSEVVSVEVVPGWREEDGSHVAGLRFSLRPGWKTYWRSAGSGGIAPSFDWSGSENVASVEPIWPRPRVFRQGDYLSIGYDTDFVLPLRIRPGSEAADVVLSGNLNIGVCADICLPAQLDVRAPLPDEGSGQADLVAALEARTPRADLAAHCTLRPTPDGAAITGQLDVPPLGGTEAVVFEVADAALWVTDAIVARAGDRLTATSEIMIGGGGTVTLDRDAVRITVIGNTGAVEVLGCAK